jgi:predicted dehydrogenase
VAEELLRYGIIGSGMMGCEHIRNLALVPGIEVVAIADSDATSLEWGRLAVGRDVEIYEDHRELLRRARVDAVVIATPNFTHHEVLRAIFETRVHVLVEKPLCTEIEQCQLARAGAHHGSTFFEHIAFRDAIRSGGKPAVAVEDGALAVAMGVAGERSARLGPPVELAELGF